MPRLEFWNEEHIAKINRDMLIDKVRDDDDFKDLKSEYNSIQQEIEELENESENIYSKITEIAIKKWIHQNDVRKIL